MNLVADGKVDQLSLLVPTLDNKFIVFVVSNRDVLSCPIFGQTNKVVVIINNYNVCLKMVIIYLCFGVFSRRHSFLTVKVLNYKI